jgi:hypothetical protein
LQQALHVAQGDGSRIGIAAIQQHLNVRFAPAVQALGVIARNHDAQQDLALVDAFFDFAV